MQSIMDLSFDQAYYQMIATPCQAMVGQPYRVDHLTSEKGKELNGKTCNVIGVTLNHVTNPQARLQCQIINDDGSESRPLLLKGCNLVPLEAQVMKDLFSNSEPLSDSEIIKGIRSALSQHDDDSCRKDLNHRIQLYKKLLEKLESRSDGSQANCLDDEEYCLPCGATYVNNHTELDNIFDWVMTVTRPACVGDKKMDLRFVDIGLKGDGVETCTICTLTLDANDKGASLVILPCVHAFHSSCLEEWLQSDLGRRNWSCPTCRAHVPNLVYTYKVAYKSQLRNRFHEFLLSGFCPKCVIWVMERNRNDASITVNERGGPVMMGDVGQMQNKVFFSPPSVP